METPAILTLTERRQKREERREKQRLQNILRAEKMHQARLKFESQKKRSVLKSHIPANSVQQYYIGCSGWFYWHWRDIFYPSTLENNKWFEYYASHFKTVELNAPFYSWPTLGTVNSWVRQVGRRKFIYTVKVNELITHTRRFSQTGEHVKDFGLIADLLKSKMGCFLFQLPPSYHYTPARLKAIVSQLDTERKSVVEFRHASWWNQKVYTAFRKAGIIFCCCSAPRLPDELIKTADDVYIRFHGIKKWYRHDYTQQELAEWVQRIVASKAMRVWVYFNNDRDGYAIKNAKELTRQLKRRNG
ncbi:MAG: DUF72 domain-containing protein [Chitinophagales bacterium]|nr:DUF72 domain-containing protein [Chitinophagales bacterium]